MKVHALKFLFILSALLILLQNGPAMADDKGAVDGAKPEAPVTVSIEISDGSLIKGELKTEGLNLLTPLSRLAIPAREVVEIKTADPGGQLTVILKNGDRITGKIDPPHFPVRSSMGDIQVDTEHVVRLEIAVTDTAAAAGGDKSAGAAAPSPEPENVSASIEAVPMGSGNIRDQGAGDESREPGGGSNDHTLSFSELPKEYYFPYQKSNYSTCFQCHDQGLAETRFYMETGFRNGDTNLHFQHINREKGRNCKCCHVLDEGGRVRFSKEVPFGKMWMLPVNVTLLKDGGNCVVGCHKPKDYDRRTPVRY